ncbi:uncharacterized protein RHOBADRAFT_52400 [Rhodotorula graminis WP1]|uniref:N-acetyltransferase domain-containing protein n=1 Tax=Rhodotorula graminis (strain WP1) TaxID=578459 RepID=A0A194S7A9_RHOGW|nr:uncharacterized protein RHOBADRAFT_52400 [Rhodotorula graminis WP1]KPV76385.1 hypothetical protein RHOBADRAFT_52400 [Rhodotorula graminis WP1]
MALRIVVHSSPLDLLRAVERSPGADSVLTNHCLGFVFARWLETCSPRAPRLEKGSNEADKPDEDVEVLVTVSEGDDLRLIFTKLGRAQCELVSPVAPADVLDLALPLLAPLVDHLLALEPFSTSPALLRTLYGPLLLVDAFLARWPHPRKAEPNSPRLPASIRSAPQRVAFPPEHSLVRIRDVETLSRAELGAIGQLLVAFYSTLSTPRSVGDDLVQHARAMVVRGAFWVYYVPRRPVGVSGCAAEPQLGRGELEPVAFLQTGRPTLRTCAIRMVYVSPSHQRQGIAQRMVSAVARAHLVEAPRLAFDLAHGPRVGETDEPTTRFGRKDEVCLSVEPGNTSARRVYAKVGFEESGDVWADVDLEGVEPGL